MLLSLRYSLLYSRWGYTFMVIPRQQRMFYAKNLIINIHTGEFISLSKKEKKKENTCKFQQLVFLIM